MGSQIIRLLMHFIRWCLRLLGMGYLVLWCYYFDTASDIKDNEWTKALPHCPCTIPDKNNTADGWAIDIGSIENNHPGATLCFRSYPATLTSQGLSGQQCCYDANGILMTEGRAAGTPDRASNTRGEDQNGTMKIDLGGVILHYFKDVVPSRSMDAEAYHVLWTPDTCQNIQY